MKTVELLPHPNHLDVKIWVEDGKLRDRSPQGVMTLELLEMLKECSEPRDLNPIKQQLWEAIGR